MAYVDIANDLSTNSCSSNCDKENGTAVGNHNGQSSTNKSVSSSPRGVVEFPYNHDDDSDDDDNGDDIVVVEERIVDSNDDCAAKAGDEESKEPPPTDHQCYPTILLVVADPNTTRFELLQIQTETDSMKTPSDATINDVIHTVIANTAEDFNLAELKYQAICNFHSNNKNNNRSTSSCGGTIINPKTKLIDITSTTTSS